MLIRFFFDQTGRSQPATALVRNSCFKRLTFALFFSISFRRFTIWVPPALGFSSFNTQLIEESQMVFQLVANSDAHGFTELHGIMESYARNRNVYE